MKSTFEILTDILRREGGFVNHPNDRGGPTNMGITQRTLSDWLGREATIDEVRTLSESTAREIYTTRYLARPRIDTLDPHLVPFMFDASVHHGPRSAIKMLQRVVNEAGFGPVSVDGVLGPKTRSEVAITHRDMGKWLINALVEERRNVFRRIIARDPSQSVFERGWMKRIEEFEVPIDD